MSINKQACLAFLGLHAQLISFVTMSLAIMNQHKRITLGERERGRPESEQLARSCSSNKEREVARKPLPVRYHQFRRDLVKIGLLSSSVLVLLARLRIAFQIPITNSRIYVTITTQSSSFPSFLPVPPSPNHPPSYITGTGSNICRPTNTTRRFSRRRKREMAEKDASVAVENAIHKLEEQPSLTQQFRKLTTFKPYLRRLGSIVDTFDAGGHEKKENEISVLSRIRGVAYDAEDVVNSLEVATNAKRRWRRLRAVLSVVGVRGREGDDGMPRHLEEQIDDIEGQMKTISKDPATSSGGAAKRRAAGGGVPENLKLFYLSLSGFPAKKEISVRKLIQIWMAEGFNKREGVSTVAVEEEGHEIVLELLEKGFIKKGKSGTSRSLKTFTMDDEQLRDCRMAARKEKFIEVIECDGAAAPEPWVRLAIHRKDGSSRHRAIGGLERYCSRVRSLQIHSNDLNKEIRALPSTSKNGGFKSLRVLDLGSSELESVPEEIGNMIHLRYLRLNAPNVNRIPFSICKLRDLQTLDMKETRKVKALPIEIWTRKSHHLCHIHLGGFATLLPPRRADHFNALDNLRTLSGICPNTDLKRLMVRAKFLNLRRLKLQIKSPKGGGSVSSMRNSRVNEEAIAFLNSLDHLYHLRSLTLSGPVGGFPEDSNAFPVSLTKMTLSKTKIPIEKCVETLEKMPNLRFLKMLEESVTGSKIIVGAGGFPALQVLRLEKLRDIKTWELRKGAMRCVRHLVIESGPELGVIPEELNKKLGESQKRDEGTAASAAPAAGRTG